MENLSATRSRAPDEGLDADVIIAGGGPCGLMLALELGRRGVVALVLNERRGTSPHPQANATQARTMEHFRRLGFSRRVREAGLPSQYPPDIAYFTRMDGYELARLQQPRSGDSDALVRTLSGSWSAAELAHRCSQMYIERILFDEASRLSSVELVFGSRVTGFQDFGDHVEVWADGDDGPRRLRARFLVGADGARSATRAQLGIRYRGERATDRPFLAGGMYSIYFRAAELYKLIPHRRAWQYWVVNPDRRGLIVALDGESEFVLQTQLRPGEDPPAMSEAEVREIVHRAVGQRFEFEILARAPWTAGLTLVAERFGAGRVFLAGDAVHLFTPTGGLGYNTAVEDAVNLGWKLAAVLQGWGGERLLESYELEREPIAQRNTAFARNFAQSLGGFQVPPEIEEDSDRGQAARQRVGARLESHARAEFNIPGITLGARYDGSPLIVGDGSAAPADSANVYEPSACPGGRAPHAWLADGRSLYDAFGFDFTLLTLTTERPDAVDGLQRAARARGLGLAVVDPAEPSLRDLYGAELALVRPDQIVCWRGDRLPSNPDQLLDQVVGGPPIAADRGAVDQRVARRA